MEHIVDIPDDWKKVDVETVFFFYVPSVMVEEEVQPIDSKFGILKSGDCMLTYDYGRFSEELSPYADYPDFQHEEIKIDGKQAILTVYTDRVSNQEFPYVEAVQFSKAEGGNRLTIFIRCAREVDREQAKQIFKTIRFK